MAKKLIGYMITWTTYGSWLQGDERGYVKNGQIMDADNNIRTICQNLQKSETVVLDSAEKEIVKQAILDDADKIGQVIKAIEVRSNHVHIAAETCSQSMEQVVSRYKNIAMFALNKNGRQGRIWTRGFDKRFCFTREELDRKIKYIQNHSIGG